VNDGDQCRVEGKRGPLISLAMTRIIGCIPIQFGCMATVNQGMEGSGNVFGLDRWEPSIEYGAA
jgi:hypothetical protein